MNERLESVRVGLSSGYFYAKNNAQTWWSIHGSSKHLSRLGWLLAPVDLQTSLLFFLILRQIHSRACDRVIAPVSF